MNRLRYLALPAALCLIGMLLAACGGPQAIDPDDTCEGKPARSQCWQELQSHPDCYVFNAFYMPGMQASWTGECRGQLAEGEGELAYVWDDRQQWGQGALVGGRAKGPWTLRHADGREENVVYEAGD